MWGESMSGDGSLVFRSVTIGAGAAETFWLGNHSIGQGPASAGGAST